MAQIKEVYLQKLNHKNLDDRNLLQAKSLKLQKIMNEKMSKRRIEPWLPTTLKIKEVALHGTAL